VRQTGGKSFRENFTKHRYYLPNYSYIGWNMRSPLFKDKRVRLAMTMMVNREEILEKIRLMTGALAVGAAQGALEAALQYAGERVQFGKPIKAFQAIKLRLADMATELEAARRLVHYGAWRDDRGLPSRKEAAMAKLFASDAAMEVTVDAVQVLGGYGYMEDYRLEKRLRDALTLKSLAGRTDDLLQRIAISAQQEAT